MNKMESNAEFMARMKRCEVCDGQGWTTQPDPRNGDATQVQCEPCLGTGAGDIAPFCD